MREVKRCTEGGREEVIKDKDEIRMRMIWICDGNDDKYKNDDRFENNHANKSKEMIIVTVLVMILTIRLISLMKYCK